MKRDDVPAPDAGFPLVFHLEPDTGVLCRVLGLFAARGLALRQVVYEAAAHDRMRLTVRTAGAPGEDLAETLRVLADKASSLVGVQVLRAQPRGSIVASTRSFSTN